MILAFIPAILVLRPWRRLEELLPSVGPDAGEPSPGRSARLLLILPLPVALAALVSMARGHLVPLLGDALGYGLFLAGAVLMRRGLADIGLARTGRWPLKTLAGLVIGLATAVTVSLGVGQDPAIAAVFGVVAAAGCYLTYGADLRSPEIAGRGRLGSHARTTLAEAAESIDAIEMGIRDIRQPELHARLTRIAALARAILRHIEDDPRDLRRARTFLNVYLEGVQGVVAGYARTHTRVSAPDLDERFRRALGLIEDVFREQEQRLLEADLDDLDVQIEVLTRQLKREGIL